MGRLHDEFPVAGYEGAMLLASNVPGAAGARRAALLKHKRFDDAELEIVGANSARGTNAGCVVWKHATGTAGTLE